MVGRLWRPGPPTSTMRWLINSNTFHTRSKCQSVRRMCARSLQGYGCARVFVRLKKLNRPSDTKATGTALSPLDRQKALDGLPRIEADDLRKIE